MIPPDFPWTNTPLHELPFVVLDLETTGIEPSTSAITEVAMVTAGPGPEEIFDTLIDPQQPIPPEVVKLTGITDEMVRGKPTLREVMPIIVSILEGSIFVSHNVPFDWGFLDLASREYLGKPLRMHSLCTLRLARRYLNLPANKLAMVARSFGLDLQEAHRALADTQAVKGILRRMLDLLHSKGIKTGGDLVRNDLLFLNAPPPRPSGPRRP
ncbi:MAG: DNA polymerase III epsilon subunit [Candidatus Ozemobacter sibiricus]|jgi:DNA polymerase-3 subunit epsilon|uniref:DNA polymerase III epsilon subunit n=1 Tax=Candidatus Ozemobacter sibiricus TaxID=2268124 RepID=A0A367ZK80_9BACT|nr:MAG: DNA polymerase III epsilon subunit [Candidatus Ozemobacter sibiricus]